MISLLIVRNFALCAPLTMLTAVRGLMGVILKSARLACILIARITYSTALWSHILIARRTNSSFSASASTTAALRCCSRTGLKVRLFGMPLLWRGQRRYFGHIAIALTGHDDAIVVHIAVAVVATVVAVVAIVGIFYVIVWRWRQVLCLFHIVHCVCVCVLCQNELFPLINNKTNIAKSKPIYSRTTL